MIYWFEADLLTVCMKVILYDPDGCASFFFLNSEVCNLCIEKHKKHVCTFNKQ